MVEYGASPPPGIVRPQDSVSGPAPFKPGITAQGDPITASESRSLVLELPIPSLPNWGVRNVAAALVGHENGLFQQSALLADQLNRNPRIQAAFASRVQSVTGLEAQFIPANQSRRAKMIAEIADEQWDQWIPPSESEALHEWELKMGFGLGQLLWDQTEFPYRPNLNLWHPSNLWWFWDFEKLFGRFQLTTGDQGTIEPISGVDGGCQWVFPQATKKRSWMKGLVRPLALNYVAWNQEFRTWARQCEKEGIAAIIATVPASADPRLVRQLEAQIRNFGSEPQATLRDGGEGNRWKLDFMQPHSTTGYLTFKDFLERNDADIAIAINGQNLTQEMRKSGARAAASTHKEVKWEYTVADARRMEVVWYEQVLRPWAFVNWGDANLAPRRKYSTGIPEDTKERASTLVLMTQGILQAQKAGIPIDGTTELERLGFGMLPGTRVAPRSDADEPGEPDDVISPSARAIPGDPWGGKYVPVRLRAVK